MDTCEITEGVRHSADPFRTIQLHPTRKCNLACLHCYSSSAPMHKEMLDIEALKSFLEHASSYGFNNISVSGGEPFLYQNLEELLIFTKKIGYTNTLATNGMLLQTERNQRILEQVDLIAVSIDGPEPLHDRIRGQKGAYKKMLAGIETLVKMKKDFGIIHTITPQSWQSLIWLGEFAYNLGAKLLQLHPLEMYGRATETMTGDVVNDTLAHQAYILANYLRSKYKGKMLVQLDLLHRDYLAAFPQIVNTFERQCAKENNISNLFDTIIIEETGKILPVAYGIDKRFEIGNVHSFSENIFEQFIENTVPELKNIFNNTLHKIIDNEAIDIINWNELIIQESKLAS